MASKISINLDTSKENFLVNKCKQNDDLTLEAYIYENGAELDLTDKEIIIQALKSDNTYIIQNTDIVKENNKILAELDRDFTRIQSTTKIEIVLIESGKQNTTFSFYLEVVRSVIDGAVESGNTVTILENLQNKIVEAGVVKEETEQLIESGGAAKKEDIININASLEEKTNFYDIISDNYSDITNQIINLFNSGINNIRIPKNKIYFATNISMPSNSHLKIDGELKHKDNSTGSFISNTGNKNISISGEGFLNGNKEKTVKTSLINFDAVDGVNINIKKWGLNNFAIGIPSMETTGCIYIKNSSNINIYTNECIGYSREGIWVKDSINVNVFSGKINGDIDSWSSIQFTNCNIGNIEYVYSYNAGASGIGVDSSNINLNNCIVHNNRFSNGFNIGHDTDIQKSKNVNINNCNVIYDIGFEFKGDMLTCYGFNTIGDNISFNNCSLKGNGVIPRRSFNCFKATNITYNNCSEDGSIECGFGASNLSNKLIFNNCRNIGTPQYGLLFVGNPNDISIINYNKECNFKGSVKNINIQEAPVKVNYDSKNVFSKKDFIEIRLPTSTNGKYCKIASLKIKNQYSQVYVKGDLNISYNSLGNFTNYNFIAKIQQQSAMGTTPNGYFNYTTYGLTSELKAIVVKNDVNETTLELYVKFGANYGEIALDYICRETLQSISNVGYALIGNDTALYDILPTGLELAKATA